MGGRISKTSSVQSLFQNYKDMINEFSFKQSVNNVSDFIHMEFASLPSSINGPHPKFFRAHAIILIFDAFNRVL